jgi:glutamate N-acetyltransferase/amino-acid N-acetyltransferase
MTTGPALARPLSLLPDALPAAEVRACLPRGFRAGAASAGIKASGRPDLAIVVVEHGPGSVAATFTTNQLQAAPVLLSRRHLAATSPDGRGSYGRVDAIISTSGSANAATGAQGLADQRRLAVALATATSTIPERTLAVSTGMIGTRLPVDRIVPEVARLVLSGLSTQDAAFADVADAMRTTDSRAKVATVAIELPGRDGSRVPVTVSGVAKGVGMIHPRMATMLAFILTDAAAEPAVLCSLLRPTVARTWNQLSVDGDTSTNDTVFLVASAASDALPVTEGSEAAAALGDAVEAVARSLARQQAADGEGATTLITCQVSGARDDPEARAVARAVVSSSLLKAAVHGHDPNWGRVAGAAGNAHLADALALEAAGMPRDEAARRGGNPVALDPAALRIGICGTDVFAGVPLAFDRVAVNAAMQAPEVLIRLDLGTGSGIGEAFGCDLTEQYVIENAEYST